MLAQSLDREGAAAQSPEEFVSHVQRRMAAVAEIYQRIVYQEQSQQLSDEARGIPTAQAVAGQPRRIPTARSCNGWRWMLRGCCEVVGRADLVASCARNLDRFLSSAATNSERYGAVLRSPAAVEQALTIFEFSDYLTDILVRHPAEVLLLDADRARPNRGRRRLVFDGGPQTASNARSSVRLPCPGQRRPLGGHVHLLRQRFRQRVFVSGARDLFQLRERVSSPWTKTRPRPMQPCNAALAIADPPAGFAVMGLGRLGSREFDLLSDADVLFVCDERCDKRGAASGGGAH